MSEELVLRPARADEAPALSALCMASKAHWGYDAAFLAACREELTLRPADLDPARLAVAERAGAPAGVVQISVAGEVAELEKLFVAPDRIGGGVGAALLSWAAATAHRLGARRLRIESDPQAVPFYARMGARQVGEAASGSIPGRMLPLLELQLRVPGATFGA